MVKNMNHISNLKSAGNILLISILILTSLTSISVYNNYSLSRQRMIDRELTEKFLAKAMVNLAQGRDTDYNVGSVKKLPHDEYRVVFKNNHSLIVDQ